jgi:hypothetical protein
MEDKSESIINECFQDLFNFLNKPKIVKVVQDSGFEDTDSVFYSVNGIYSQNLLKDYVEILVKQGYRSLIIKVIKVPVLEIKLALEQAGSYIFAQFEEFKKHLENNMKTKSVDLEKDVIGWSNETFNNQFELLKSINAIKETVLGAIALKEIRRYQFELELNILVNKRNNNIAKPSYITCKKIDHLKSIFESLHKFMVSKDYLDSSMEAFLSIFGKAKNQESLSFQSTADLGRFFQLVKYDLDLMSKQQFPLEFLAKRIKINDKFIGHKKLSTLSGNLSDYRGGYLKEEILNFSDNNVQILKDRLNSIESRNKPRTEKKK